MMSGSPILRSTMRRSGILVVYIYVFNIVYIHISYIEIYNEEIM